MKPAVRSRRYPWRWYDWRIHPDHPGTAVWFLRLPRLILAVAGDDAKRRLLR